MKNGVTFARSCSGERHANIKAATIAFLLMCTTAVFDAALLCTALDKFRFQFNEIPGMKFQYLACVILTFGHLLGSSFPIKLAVPLVIDKILGTGPYYNTETLFEM